jgi:hypothetical protein
MNIFLEAADILSRVTTTDKYALVIRSLIESSGEKEKPKCPECGGTGYKMTPGMSGAFPCPKCKPAPSPGSSSIEGYPASVKQALTVPAPLPAEVEGAVDFIRMAEGADAEEHALLQEAVAVLKAALSKGVEWEKREGK